MGIPAKITEFAVNANHLALGSSGKRDVRAQRTLTMPDLRRKPRSDTAPETPSAKRPTGAGEFASSLPERLAVLASELDLVANGDLGSMARALESWREFSEVARRHGSDEVSCCAEELVALLESACRDDAPGFEKRAAALARSISHRLRERR